MATMHVNDIDIYYEEHGDATAEPVLLIMGFASNAGAWAPQIPTLRERYRVIAFDNRGAGRTTQPEGPYTVPQLAADAAGLLDALGIESAHIVGASMGGMIAQEFVLRYPRRVRSLVLACTTPGGPHSFGYAEMVDGSKELQTADNLAHLMTPEAMQRGIDVMFTPAFMSHPGEGFAAMIMTGIQHPSTLAGLKGQSAAVLGHDTYDRLPQIKVPTLVIAGTDDTLVDARNSPLLAERIRGAELRMFEGLRHGFTAERPDLVNTAILEFIARASAGREQPREERRWWARIPLLRAFSAAR